MNKIISIITLNSSSDTKKAIKRIIDQLEKHNYALTNHNTAVRVMSKYIPSFYKENDVIMFSRYRKRQKSIITIDPSYQIKRKKDFCFRIKLK